MRKAIIKQVTNSPIKNLEVFPNPATNFINFTDDNELQGSQVIITDMAGRLVLNTEYKKKMTVNSIEPGTYLIQIITKNNEIHQCKFVKL